MTLFLQLYVFSVIVYFFAYVLAYQEIALLDSYFKLYTTATKKFSLPAIIILGFIPLANVYCAIGYIFLKRRTPYEMEKAVILYSYHKKINKKESLNQE